MRLKKHLTCQKFAVKLNDTLRFFPFLSKAISVTAKFTPINTWIFQVNKDGVAGRKF